MTDPQRTARHRQQERAEHVEHILEQVPDEEGAYPTNSDELAIDYRAAETDLVNETETLADALDRLADNYDTFADPEEARAALTDELRRDERFDEVFSN
ncbi:hypothetical protein [Natronomonas sp. EA1]|uniref:hypothetical protein n=1 Tax=Natronomonas sp. EA1 TaxID=3421655 RepID=UPI003EB8E867